MKRLLHILILGFLILSSQTSFAQWTGNGTIANPYQITDTTGLRLLSNSVRTGSQFNNVHFILINNLDLTGFNNFTPIGGWNSTGSSSSGTNLFNGIFDGNGKVISNLTILKDSTSSNNTYVALFGRIGASGLVKNLGLHNARVRGYTNVAALCGRLQDGTIENCFSTGLIGAYSSVGGLVGYSDGGIVRNCYSTANVYGVIEVGGFAGILDYADTQHCYCSGNVSGNLTTCAFANATWGVNFFQYSMAESVLRGSSGNNAGFTLTFNQMTDGTLLNNLNTGLNPPMFKSDISMINNGFPILIWQYTAHIMTKEVSNITETSAKLNGLIIETGVTFDSIGFYYREPVLDSLTTNTWRTIIGNYTGNMNVSINLTGLNPNTNYEFKAYMAKDTNLYFGDILNFKTLNLPVEVSTDSVSFVSNTSAKLYGYANVGTYNLVSRGFEYKKRSDQDFITVLNIGTSDSLEAIITDLSLNTYYTFRTFIESEQGKEYGENITFIMLEAGLVRESENQINVSLYPNPTNNQSKLQISGINTQTRLTIIDIQGRIIKKELIKPTNNSINTIIDLSKEPKGIYYIKLENQTTSRVEKIIKM
ncbi:MAG: T9SS type A sorting domain-containing protein [Bacteroidales bacterium]|nr:T9SS type A sorting domain-containing protein [Bacteroidales bacterium]